VRKGSLADAFQGAPQLQVFVFTQSGGRIVLTQAENEYVLAGFGIDSLTRSRVAQVWARRALNQTRGVPSVVWPD
jgi:hypothetical protein